VTGSVVALESAERDALVDLYRAAAPALAAASGLRVAVAGATAFFTVPQVDVLALNRMVGLGLDGPPTAEAWAMWLDAIRSSGAPRFFVPVAPADRHGETTRMLEAAGLRPYNNWVRLERQLAAGGIPPDDGGVEVRPIGPELAAAFGRIVAEAFHYPPSIASLAAQTVGRANWHHYMAFDDGVPVATGAMFLAGETAWFSFAATEERFRRRGAQRALVLRRLAEARDRGIERVSVETAEDSVRRDAPSFRNLRRLGFEIAYLRPNYLWTRPAPDA
jgi:GNAT superfamily N-acetyltransferase